MLSLRHERVRELLKRAIGEAIRREFHVNDVGLITVNDIDVGGDLKSAVVFISILGNAEQQKHGLQVLDQNRVRLQGLVAQSVVLKFTPTLKFVVDSSIVRGNRVLQIIEELEKTAPAEEPQPPDDFGVKQHPQIIDRVLEAIREHQTFCIAGHVRPDGDCIGSQLGLALALRNEGKTVTVWNQDTVPQKYKFLNPDGLLEKPRPGEKFDCVITTDCASYERLGKVGDCVRDRKILINIDHHQSNPRYGDVNWVSPRTLDGELIYRLMKVARWPITRPIADLLFTAISTDTGSFQYPNTRPGTFHVGAELVTRGANLSKICDEVYQSYPLSRAKLLQHVYSKFRLAENDRIAWFWLKQADFSRTGAESDDTEGLIDHIRAIEPVVVACVFEELEPGLTRISLRSKDARVNVNEIAAQFGGGGHTAAAGARIAGSALSTQRRVIAAIKKALKAAR